MDENVKKEFAELQKEMTELKKTVDEYKNWMNNEGAELEDMLRDLKDIPDDSYEAPQEDEMDIHCYQCFSSIRVKKDIPIGMVVTCPECGSQQKYWDCECPQCHIQHHPDEPHPEQVIRFNMMVMGKSEEDIAAFLENLNKKCNLPSTDKNSGLNKISELPLIPVMMGLMTSSLNPKDIKEQNPKSGAEDNNKNNEMESSGKLQGDMVYIPPKGDNRDNEMKTKALQGTCVDTSNSGLLGVLKKLFGK